MVTSSCLLKEAAVQKVSLVLRNALNYFAKINLKNNRYGAALFKLKD